MKYQIFIVAGLLYKITPYSYCQEGLEYTNNPLVTEIEINDTLSGDFSFTKNWDYSWPIYRDEETGKLKNGLNENIRVKKKDAIPQYYTANCSTNHQGEHLIRYCEATLFGDDTLVLEFADCDAAYHGYLKVTLVKDSFSSQWYCDYVFNIPGEQIYFTSVIQEIEVCTFEFKIGQLLKGKINMIFREVFSAPDHETESSDYYINGLFETKIQ